MKINIYPKTLALAVLSLGLSFGVFAQSVRYDCTDAAPPLPGPPGVMNTGGGCSVPDWNSEITRVTTTGGIINFDNPSVCPGTTPAYSDFTNTGKIVQQNGGKSIDVKIYYKGNSKNITKSQNMIYVDWNRNGKFDLPQEYVAAPGWNPATPANIHPHANPGINSTVTIKVPIPGYAKEGITRMRIVSGALFQSPVPIDRMSPCFSSGDGEIEDYDIDIINPCLPPSVSSVAKLGNFSTELSWSVRENAEFYEYLLTTSPVPPTSIGYSFTKDTKLFVDTLKCDVTYYLYVRTICDTAGRTDVQWKKSDWKIDSFKTHPCCNIPDVKVDQINSTTARFSWDAIYTATGYEYAVSTTPTPPVRGDYTVNNIVLKQGLSPSTRYYVFVRARCKPTPLSGWHIQNFKTEKYTSVEEVNGNTFSINAYPNPMADNVIVKLDGQRAANARLTVIDLTGKVVYNAPVTTQEVKINTGNFAPGLYVIKYADDLHNEVMRITKK